MMRNISYFLLAASLCTQAWALDNSPRKDDRPQEKTTTLQSKKTEMNNLLNQRVTECFKISQDFKKLRDQVPTNRPLLEKLKLKKGSKTFITKKDFDEIVKQYDHQNESQRKLALQKILDMKSVSDKTTHDIQQAIDLFISNCKRVPRDTELALKEQK